MKQKRPKNVLTKHTHKHTRNLDNIMREGKKSNKINLYLLAFTLFYMQIIIIIIMCVDLNDVYI